MERRKMSEIKRDLRALWGHVALGREMNEPEIIEYTLREIRALEREMELRRTGYVLTTMAA